MPRLVGRTNIRHATIVREHSIGDGAEGTVYHATAHLKRKKVPIAEKEFYSPAHARFLASRISHAPNLQRPVRQFKVYRQLYALNQQKKLGLPLIPTLRLIKGEKGRARLIMTRLNPVLLDNLTHGEQKVTRQIMRRAEEVLLEQGYLTHSDIWIIHQDPKTGKVRPFIADFGNIKRKLLGPVTMKQTLTSWVTSARKRTKKFRTSG